MTEYIVWGDGRTLSLRHFTTRDAALEETDGLEHRWHDASEIEGAETWATVVTEATDIEIGSAVAGDANVWGFCSLPIR